jgi:hypothetical protein
MSASTQAAPRQISFGRFPTAFAALALVVILAVVVALVALNGAKTAAPATTSGFGHGPGDWYAAPAAPAVGAPPAAIDHHEDIGTWAPSLIPSYGGFGGPRLIPSDDGLVGPRLGDGTPVYIPSVITDATNPGSVSTDRGGHNGTRRAQ